MFNPLVRACFVVLLLSATTGYADFDEGIAAYQKGDYQTTLKEFKSLAEQGDARVECQPFFVQGI